MTFGEEEAEMRTVAIAVILALASPALLSSQDTWYLNPQNYLLIGSAPSLLQYGDHFFIWYHKDGEIYLAYSPDALHWNSFPSPALTRGEPGTWDDDNVDDPSVIFDGDRFLMFYGGSDGMDDYIGMATSTDGRNWTKPPLNPKIFPDHTYDADGAFEPSVLRIGDQLCMWYRGQPSSLNDYICIALSDDNGSTWYKPETNPVMSGSGWDLCLYSPQVYESADSMTMLYSGRADPWSDSKIGIAYSHDAGYSWEKYSDNPLVIQNSNNIEEDPLLIEIGNHPFLFFSSSEIYRATITPIVPTVINHSGSQIGRGESLSYEARMYNQHPDSIVNVQGWIMAELPNGNQIPIIGEDLFFNVQPLSELRANLRDRVPLNAPLGAYKVILNVGFYPNDIWSFDSFNVEVTD
jgi:predicted GH43/DUF377 family glycosyl hydrolase